MPDTAAHLAHSQLSELRVSGHTMTLDPGLYCIFNAPEGPAPNAETGLPVVRISPAPGRLANGIELLGLDPNGWIGPEAATLVRVKQSRSSLLVTVYQAPDSESEAPQLQVVRISGASAAVEAAERLRPASSEGQPDLVQARSAPEPVEVVAHVYGRGDVGTHVGTWVGEPGSKRWIEGFGISGIGTVPDAEIEYQAVLGRGWLSPWSAGGQFCGSRGMSLPILGLRVRLLGAAAASYRVVLSATFVDGSRVGPVGGGEACEAPTLAALEAFQLSIEINATAPTPVEPLVAPVAEIPSPVVKGTAKAAKPKTASKSPTIPVLVSAAATSRTASARRR